MRVRVLGPLEISDGTEGRRIGAAKQRALLAALAVRAPRPVSTDRLVEEIWPGSPPASAINLVQGYVASLRRALGDSDGQLLRTQSPGYQLVLPPEELDVGRLESLTDQGKRALADGRSRTASDLLAEALSLWRGQPFTDVVTTAAVAAETARLEQLRLAALEARIDADLNLGRHGDLVPELQALTEAHPLLERFWGQLMLALYRGGRQAEALDAYRRLYRLLDDELGIEPSRPVRELHQQILVGDQALDTSSALPERADGLPGRGTARPRQLPAGVGDFTGRLDELAQLDALLPESESRASPAVVISAITGTAGVGKTTLAVHWAHRVADRFPDGQLYVNLGGFDPVAQPVRPSDAVRAFLDALGVAPDRVPVDLEDQAALYRSLVADRRLLVVLDNARNADQVRPLLPGSPGCLVLITSRSRFESLIAIEAARPIPIDLLGTDESHDLLANRLGMDRVTAEPEAVNDIISSCAGLPLALAIVAARAATHPHLALATLAAELDNSRTSRDLLSLEPFAGGDHSTDLRAVFSWSYRRLDPAAQRLFRLLGLHPGPDITAPAAASLAGQPLTAARGLLVDLCQAHLLTEHVSGRYTFHDLLRTYAAELAHLHDTDHERRTAIHRMLDHYLHTAYAGDRLLLPHRDTVPPAPVRAGVSPEPLDHYDQAMAWFTHEHVVLLGCLNLAETHRFDSHAWQLAAAQETFLHRRGHRQDRTTTSRAARNATIRLGDKSAQADALRLLARTEFAQGRLEDAYVQAEQALGLSAELGDHTGEAQSHMHLGWICDAQHKYGESLDHARRALTLFRSAGHRRGESSALNAVGWSQAHLGRYEQALESCEQALALHQDLGNRYDEINTLDSLGYVHHRLGDPESAVAQYRRAITLSREGGNRYDEATILTHLADVQHDAAQHNDAIESLTQALSILEDLDHPDVEDVRTRLAAISPTTEHE